ncbi:MAG: cytochrome c maturation protein CcmE [Candidatus Thorarchaeota archaeon]|nr:MAG: cytochrome c maturation protein CcmE [Candidatus Thorarchaeota archaeon]
MKKKTRIAAIAIILVATIGLVAYAMLNLFVDPYVSVDEVVENPDAYMGRTIQVKGTLQPGSLTVTADNVTLVIEGDNRTITVLLLGEVPDMMDGQEIVAIGTLESASLIRATEILTSCPSKYEANSTATY